MTQQEKMQVGITIHVQGEKIYFFSVVRLTLLEWYNQ